MYSPAVTLNVNESVMCIICGPFVLVLYTGIKSVLEPNQPTCLFTLHKLCLGGSGGVQEVHLLMYAGLYCILTCIKQDF